MLQINLKSFQYTYIQQTISKIYEITFFLGLANFQILGLPRKKKLYTVLKSPHKDKKSREQFESKRWKTAIIINTDNKKTLASLLFFIIKNSEFPGVEVQICLKKNSYL